MNISEEKRYLYEMMKDITSERRTLSEMYMQLKQRLAELEKLEERGLTDLDVESFLEYSKNKSVDLLKTNVTRELKRIEEVTGKPVVQEDPKPVVQATDIQSLKDYDDRVSGSDRRMDRIKIIDFIASYMRQTNKKMKSTDIDKLIRKEMGYDLKKSTLSNIIYRLQERHEDVVKIKYGVYGVKKPRKKRSVSTYSKTNETSAEGNSESSEAISDQEVVEEESQNEESSETTSNEDIHEQQNLLDQPEEKE